MTKNEFDPQLDNLSPHGDAFYAELMSAHDGLPPKESEVLNARLVLLMANAIGDIDMLKAIIAKAKTFKGK
jgi:hypothetical protein